MVGISVIHILAIGGMVVTLVLRKYYLGVDRYENKTYT